MFVARTLGTSAEEVRAILPASTVAPTRSVAAPRATPTEVAQELATPTVVRTRATAAPTVRATPTATVRAVAAAPTATTVAARTATATPVQAQATPTHVPQPAATGVASVVPVASPTTVAITASQQRTGAGSIALTFDAGADRGYAEDILDRLTDDHVVASFGITGAWARSNPDLVRRMAADGHLVFNHTLDHRSFTGVSDSLGGLSPAQRRTELDQADAIIAPLIGHSTKPFYRLPYGDDDSRVASDVGSDGYTRKIGWTIDSEGWRGLLSQDILARCLKLAAPGAVYVFHVGRASQDAAALPQLLAGLRERGFTFVRVDQL